MNKIVYFWRSRVQSEVIMSNQPNTVSANSRTLATMHTDTFHKLFGFVPDFGEEWKLDLSLMTKHHDERVDGGQRADNAEHFPAGSGVKP